MSANGIVKVWAGSWVRYTEGKICGAWLELPMPPEELSAALRRIDPGVEDWGCYDIKSDDLPALEKRVGDYTGPEALNGELQGIVGLGQAELEQANALLEYGHSIPDALKSYQSAHWTPLEDLEDFGSLGRYFAKWERIFDDAPDRDAAHSEFERYGRDLAAKLTLVDTDDGIFAITC